MNTEYLAGQSPFVLKEFNPPPEWNVQVQRGKVRDIFPHGNDELMLVTTDRKSAFDRNLGFVPYTGQVNNELTQFWMNKLGFIVPNHLLEVPDDNAMLVKKAAVRLPVEVVVRGHITGVTDTSIWGSYARGDREIYGIQFRDGYQQGDKLDEPIITPTTKADHGHHDERLTSQQVVEKGITSQERWDAIQRAALKLYTSAYDIALARGLILMDTKMEFGIDKDGNLMLIDELFTGDSSRFVLANMYPGILHHLDKEFLRINYKQATGYTGHGDPPPIPELLAEQTSERYVRLYEMLTGKQFHFPQGDIGKRITTKLDPYFKKAA